MTIHQQPHAHSKLLQLESFKVLIPDLQTPSAHKLEIGGQSETGST